MQFTVQHATRFVYSQPVFCEPMTIRLRPREDSAQRLNDFDLKIDPQPKGRTDGVDLAGNVVSIVWFDELLSELSIQVDWAATTSRVNPFDFVLPAHAATVPLAAEDNDLWRHYARARRESDAVVQLAEKLSRETNSTIDFLMNLSSHIYDNCETVVRETGDPWPAERTLAEQQGSCRDQAVLFNEVCRVLQMPARFVSGYVPPQPEQDEQYLHAWSEVYLPGAGWRGFDPTLGLAVSDAHVAAAAAGDPLDAAPTTGSFRRTGASSILQSSLTVSAESEATC